nr:MAG TPA: hypothetical protein [Caudoviricetes sp.]
MVLKVKKNVGCPPLNCLIKILNLRLRGVEKCM